MTDAIQKALPVDPHGIPEPSPFAVQPWDPIALSVIRVWIMMAMATKVNPDKIARAERHYAEIKQWQKVNGTRKPD